MHESGLRVLIGTKVRNAVKSKESNSFDMEEFDALNERIFTAKADDAEIRRFRELAELYAFKEVEEYQKSEEHQKEIIDYN